MRRQKCWICYKRSYLGLSDGLERISDGLDSVINGDERMFGV